MSEEKDKDSNVLKAKPQKKLQLSRTVEGGSIQQNLGRGAGTKTIQVEVRKTRTFAPPGQKPEEKEEAPAKKEADGGKLSQSEQSARLKALSSAKEQAKTEQPPAPTKKAQEKSEKPEEAAAQEAAPEIAPPDLSDVEAQTQKKPHGGGKKAAPAAAEEEKKPVKKAPKKRQDEGRRQSGKLTLSQIIHQETRTRSLSVERRARERAKRRSAGDIAGPAEKIIREVVIPETITVQELANRMAVRGVDVVKELMKLGVMATVNQAIDADTAELIVTEFGHKFKRVTEADVEKVMVEEEEDDPKDLQPRPPVVTVMGHVDHGKTSLLDALRETDVTAGEAGGITQHIGAYQTQLEDGSKITFLDTPGHAAFTAMRARGSKVTDIVILVVAADDGVMPQTEEAINHAKAAEVPIIVAINKIDKPDADVKKIKDALLAHELIPEDLGGDIMVAEVSAKEKIGLDTLSETILLQAEVLELKANPNTNASGVVIEAKVDPGKGTVATLLIQRGTLKTGDIVVAGGAFGKVRALMNDKGQAVEEAPPALPVEILGLNEAPEAGEKFVVVESEKQAREITEFRYKRARDVRAVAATGVSLDDMFKQAGAEETKKLAVIVKSDVKGSAEAITQSLEKLNELTDNEAQVQVVHNAVGGITESDVNLAKTVNANIVGFNVRANPAAKELAANEGLEIRYYSVIYDLVDDMKDLLSGMLKPHIREEFLGTAEILQVFKVSKIGKVAGCMVKEGTIKRGAGVRLIRDDVVIHEGKLKTLKRFKDEVNEVKSGTECGMAFESYDDLKEGDVIEAFDVIEENRTL